MAVSSLVSIKHSHHFRIWRNGVPIDLLQAVVQVGGLGVGLALALDPGHPDDWDAVHLVQRVNHLLAKGNGAEGLTIVALLVVLWGIVTQVDVHCKVAHTTHVSLMWLQRALFLQLRLELRPIVWMRQPAQTF